MNTIRLITFLCLPFVLSNADSMTVRASESPPNILLIISDDQAWTDYSFMGHRAVSTPNIDRLAAEGLAFPRGYVPSSLCSPSLVSIITGLFPHQHRMTSNDPPIPEGKKGKAIYLDPGFRAQQLEVISYIEEVPTLPRLLAAKDYLSFQSGKWWMGDHRRGGFTHGMTHGDPDRGGRHGDEGLEIGRKGLQPVYDFMRSARAEGHPFFVWYAPFLPHQPHNPPERLLAKYRDLTPSIWVARYWAMIEWFDETVGDLTEFLDEEGLADNTLVVYVTDNGWIQDPSQSKYAARSKRSPYDGGLRTPLILRWPGKISPAYARDLVTSLDIAPTILAAAQLPIPPELTGINLLDTTDLAKRRAIFGECFTHNAIDIHDPSANLRWRWVIRDDWKLIVPYAINEGDAPVELYHLGTDPYEEENLAVGHPAIVEKLELLLDGWWNPL